MQKCDVKDCDESVCEADMEFKLPSTLRFCQKHRDIVEDFISKEDGISLFKWWIKNLDLQTRPPELRNEADQRYGDNPVSEHPTSYKICPWCVGTGGVEGKNEMLEKCPKCNGTGQIPDEKA